MTKQTKIIIGLGIALLIATAYIGYTSYKERQLENNIFYFSEGQLDAVVKIWQQTNECNIMGMTIGNQTKSLVDVGCLTQESGE